MTLFSDRNEVEVVENLSGSDAQSFVNVIDEVNLYTILPSKPRTMPFTSTESLTFPRLDVG